MDQCASDKQPVRVLLQSSVAQLHKSELQLHHLKHMLHLGTHARFGSVLCPLEFVNLILVPVATMSVVLRARCALLNYMALSLISLITPNPGFFPMQQIGKHRRIGNVRRRSHRGVDDLGLTCRNTRHCLSWSGASPDRAAAPGSSSTRARAGWSRPRSCP